MVRFKFFVNCEGWKDGGYANSCFAESKAHAKRIVKEWNSNDPGRVKLLSVEQITNKEFTDDFIDEF